MNKVIAAFDGFKLSESTIDYSIYLAKEFDAHIVATFLQDMAYHQPWEEGEKKHIKEKWKEVNVAIEKEEKTTIDSIKSVEKKFNAAGIHYNVHKDRIIAIQSLVHESYFSDMLLINSRENFSNWDTAKPSKFLQDLLAKSDCPLLLAPPEFKPVEKVVFAYDGTPSSTYAMRMFSYLFPSMGKLELEIVIVSDDLHNNHLPDYKLLKELLKRKFSNFESSVLKSNYTIDALIEYVQNESKNCVVVLGAYHRSSISRWLYESTANALIMAVEAPLFIAHK
jgi:nucleotide-binding universal stress UspA family protein